MSDSEDEDEEPAQLHIRKVAHMGGINRVRACPQQQQVVATWGDSAQVQVHGSGGKAGGRAGKAGWWAGEGDMRGSERKRMRWMRGCGWSRRRVEGKEGKLSRP